MKSAFKKILYHVTTLSRNNTNNTFMKDYGHVDKLIYITVVNYITRTGLQRSRSGSLAINTWINCTLTTSTIYNHRR